jgi:thiol:disulfide interchange protein DsbD
MRTVAVLLTVVTLLASVPALAAQDEGHVVEVRSLVSRDAVRPGETFQAAVVLRIQAGYHINDNAPLDEFMIPTVLTVLENPDFEIVEIYYPGGRRARFAYSEAELVVYEGEVVLGALLKARDGVAPGPKLIKASLGYQACDAMSCLPPKELAFEIAVPVSAAGGSADVKPEVFKKLRFKSLRK